MTSASLPITAPRVEAFAASALRLLGWLLAMVMRGGWSGRSKRLRHILSRAERYVECVLCLKAIVLFGPLPKRRPHPRSAPPGFRRARRRMRLFFRSARIRAGKRAGALARVLALLDALAKPERAVAHFLKQLSRGTRLTGLVAAAPRADALAADAYANACAISDTS
jgi:hypothetical protein